jgi:hypothetical protein
VALSWLAFSGWYFGAIIPHSIVAKRIIGRDENLLLDRQWLKAFAAWSAPFVGACAPFLVWLGLLLFAGGAIVCLRRASSGLLRLTAIYTLAFPAALWLGGAPLYFDWHLAPVIYTGIITGGVGIGWAVTRARAGRLPRVTFAAFAIAWLALTGARDLQTSQVRRDYQINEDGTRRAIGEWLARETPPDATVAMEAIGYQGYYSRRRVVDLAGIVSPRVVAIRQASRNNAEAFYRILQDLRPDYLVLRSWSTGIRTFMAAACSRPTSMPPRSPGATWKGVGSPRRSLQSGVGTHI